MGQKFLPPKKRVILSALIETKPRDFLKVHPLFDALEVVYAIKEDPGQSIDPILQDTISMVTSFDLFVISHNPRTMNVVAYNFAMRGLNC